MKTHPATTPRDVARLLESKQTHLVWIAENRHGDPDSGRTLSVYAQSIEAAALNALNRCQQHGYCCAGPVCMTVYETTAPTVINAGPGVSFRADVKRGTPVEPLKAGTGGKVFHTFIVVCEGSKWRNYGAPHGTRYDMSEISIKQSA